ncbi:site-specific integrase [Pontibacter harenae]|uniref:site-specific integrase n=1 Tax=Pontibacter harenae TaxID=2894083 RepID=UPI001E486EAC|nr:site-specific integrase [Pontibacter harenae]MCC9168632.1 site-specific integrase [Pontibacter harenae]
MTVKYYLDKPNGDAVTAVYLFARMGKQTVKVKTGDFIHPRFWNIKPNKDGNHVKGTYSDVVELNYSLDNLRNRVRNAFKKRMEENPAFRFPDFKEDILALLHPAEPKVGKTFLEYYDEYIGSSESHRSPSTLRKYRGIYNHLVNFSEKKKYPLTFEGINMRFFDEMKDYLVKDLKHTDNTVWKTFATLKAFMVWALERDLHQNLSFRKFKAIQREVDTISLTEKELQTLYEKDLSKNPRLGRVRDVFCFACYTGQRYSDLEKLRRSDIKGNVWALRQKKTDSVNRVPLLPQAMAILERYSEDAAPLPVLSNQKMNDYLKELGELAGLDEPTSVTSRRGGERIEDTKPKYDFITMHTARRTFITLSLEKGLRPEIVMRVSGHTNYQTFKKYIKITDRIKEQEMLNVWAMPKPKAEPLPQE